MPLVDTTDTLEHVRGDTHFTLHVATTFLNKMQGNGQPLERLVAIKAQCVAVLTGVYGRFKAKGARIP